MDIRWRSEDQRVSHLNYTHTWKHRWASNKEKTTGFTGNLNHIFPQDLLSGCSRCRNACTDSGETFHAASLRSLFPEATAVILRYKSYRDQQSSGNLGNMRQPATLKQSRAEARVWPHGEPSIHCGHDIASVATVPYWCHYYSRKIGEYTLHKGWWLTRSSARFCYLNGSIKSETKARKACPSERPGRSARLPNNSNKLAAWWKKRKVNVSPWLPKFFGFIEKFDWQVH